MPATKSRDHAHTRLLFAGATLAILSAAGCGGDSTEEPPSTDIPALPALNSYEEVCQTYGCDAPSGTTTAIWRVELQRDAQGVVTIVNTRQIDSPQRIDLPPSPQDGSHLLVAYGEDAQVLSTFIVRFPEEVSFLNTDQGIPFHTSASLEGERVRAVAYVRAAGLARLSLIDRDEVEVDTRSADALTQGLGLRQQALASAPASCPHVDILEQGDEAYIPASIKGDIVTPDHMQLGLIHSALSKMGPLACQAVGRIAILVNSNTVGGDTSGAVSTSAGDLILLNGDTYNERTLNEDWTRRMAMMSTLFHESTHAVQNLMGSRAIGGGVLQGLWSDEGLRQGSEYVELMRMKGGFFNEMPRLHDAFVAYDFARPYLKLPKEPKAREEAINQLRFLGEDEVARGGATSRYGLTNWADDQAEMVANSKIALLFKQQGLTPIRGRKPGGSPLLVPEDSACVALREQGPTLPGGYAAVFTKLRLVHQLGLLTDDEYEHCRGSKINIERDIQGMAFKQGDGAVRSFETNVKAIMGDDSGDGKLKFLFTSNGTLEFGETTSAAEASLKLTLPQNAESIEQISWPRGIYSLGVGSGHSFIVHLPDAPAGSFDVYDGDVLIFEASNKVISGSIVVREAMRWLAPVPVPQVFDPPLSVRFSISKE